MSETLDYGVVVVGGGIAGMAAALFTARAELDTLIVNKGTSILNRNAHLENYPGFPRGINPRLFVDMFEEQVRRSGVEIHRKNVNRIQANYEAIRLGLGSKTVQAGRVILASWSDLSYARDLPLEWYEDESKRFIQTDGSGRTTHPLIYAAGRIAGTRHQAIVAAGDGADVGLSVVEDLLPNFYHDWVVPEDYFTGRGREVPEGCEEISNEERKRRARLSRTALMEHLEETHPKAPEPHPSQTDD